ncbi:transmembrane protein 217 [Hemicordylus capensis]|uniref:transmembrane protein 217 n=1 Tax=Hemicordylus capensis TaxID=884348 RepID=UPI0023032DB8|nr:transmembrane protein 217 [Hemicordylus capensis]XP_053101189.1 transmembrane protein 217 [Hemicordylus capensis]XP_053101190.1 transmembrane protein 217 [Hemicordylus capensis]XP_053101191.1 transmembrane protein 217 [Hemicordylus capensis]XP_053101192.1 transmembrane protein 217 [Hemicordylus capensis]XP_053101193.1 transmembrane protein 217 [Hemicordylus capensis]XP_053101194.1 transmembrane protein 217 [Hemicordylus capensis]XP_053101195.1 transmembrane protein 217 [Hemicordylus capen
MILLLANGFCGMLPKTGAVVAGLYMITMTNMYLIFETGHLNRSLTLSKKAMVKGTTTSLLWVLPSCYYAAIGLAVVTYPICIYYIYSVIKRNIMGICVYIAWIIFYDLANCVIIVLTAKAAHQAKFKISPLEWFGLATRIPTDCFWLSFTVTYAILIMESQSTGRMSLKVRRASRQVVVPPRLRLGSIARRIQ